MAKRIDWDRQIGRRIRLRDLHALMTVAKLGSMGKAAKELGVSQPAISEVIAELEHSLGVKLLDRTSQGVEPNAYGAALLKRSVAAFDEIIEAVKEIEHLADPTSGEIRIGCPESVAAAYLQSVMDSFLAEYPGVVLDVDTVNTLTFSPRLRERKLDVVLARAGWPLDDPKLTEDLSIESLFDDALVVVVGLEHPLARRGTIRWAELENEQWVLTGPDSWNYKIVADAFTRNRLRPPKIQMRTLSVHLRAHMVATGRYVTTFPRSVLLVQAEQLGLRTLPVKLPSESWPILAVTLKNRMQSPVVARFLDHARKVARALSKRKGERRVQHVRC